MTTTKESLAAQAIALMYSIEKIYKQFQKHRIVYTPFDADFDGEKTRKRLIGDFGKSNAAKTFKFAPKIDEVAKLQDLHANLSKRLDGAKIAIFGTALQKMQNRALRDIDLERHKQAIIMEVATALKVMVSQTPVAYRPYGGNEYMKQLISNLALYFSGNPLGEYDLRKGLYLYGFPQTGKSMIFKALQKVFKDTVMAFEIVDCTALVNDLAVGKIDYLQTIERLTNGNLLLDDIGHSDPHITLKGVRVNLIGTLYRLRLARAAINGCNTFLTSNFDLDSMETRQNDFGNMFFSVTEIERIRLNCNVIAMPLLTNH